MHKNIITLHVHKKQGPEIYNKFTFTEENNKMKLKPIMDPFEDYCKPQKNIIQLRHQFFTYHQQEVQLFDSFVTKLKKTKLHCEFQTLKDSLIRDKIVIGSASIKLRVRLLRIEYLMLAQAIKLGQVSEATKQHAHKLSRPPTATCQHAGDSLKVELPHEQ